MITPVLLVGGEGRRLWPLSTPERPKPFLPLTGPSSLFQETLARLARADLFAPPIVVGAAEHASLIREQGRETEGLRIALEPCPRNTAPAAAVGALLAEAADPGALVLIAPADHLIANPDAFHAAVAAGAFAAREGAVVLIDPVSQQYMAGSEIDFVEDLIGASFKVKNPNATASCGCGTSFAL